MEMKPEFAPPREIAKAIHRVCFDYQDPQKDINGKTGEERVYECYQHLRYLLINDPRLLIFVIQQGQDPDYFRLRPL